MGKENIEECKAKAVYAVILISLLVGVAIDFININPIQARYWSPVLNGLLAPCTFPEIKMDKSPG